MNFAFKTMNFVFTMISNAGTEAAGGKVLQDAVISISKINAEIQKQLSRLEGRVFDKLFDTDARETDISRAFQVRFMLVLCWFYAVLCVKSIILGIQE